MGASWFELSDGAVVGPGGETWAAALAQARRELAPFPPARRLLVASTEPLRFFALAHAALAAGHTVALGSTRWGQREWTAARAQVRPHAVWGGAEVPAPPEDFAEVDGPQVLLATGGTSGSLRFAIHDAATLGAAARAFAEHFGLPTVSTLGVLPAHHIGGWQPSIRALVSGGTLRLADWKRLEAGEPPAGDFAGWALSLVPTQLARLLANPATAHWLRRFAVISLGGAAADPALMAAARAARLPLSPAYGATETAAQVAALRPVEFLAGAGGCGPPLPHARIQILDADASTGDGLIAVEAISLFRGYFPAPRPPGLWRSGDIGRLDASGALHVRGRADATIVTGGEKVHPAEVEAAVRATGLLRDVAVIGLPDERWGETVVACYPAAAAPDLVALETALREALSPAARPKRWVPLNPWPATAAGKVDRTALRAAIG
jgi:O-succinylbenzoic acid--CoA ligase